MEEHKEQMPDEGSLDRLNRCSKEFERDFACNFDAWKQPE